MTQANDESRVAILEWQGQEYQLRYTFGIVRRIRAEGINLPRLFRELMANPDLAADYGDEFAALTAFLLREAGAEVTPEQVWRLCLSDRQFARQAMALFTWIGTQHFATSENVPKPEALTPANTTTSQSD